MWYHDRDTLPLLPCEVPRHVDTHVKEAVTMAIDQLDCGRLRVAEKIALLDELSDGRVIFGMGRGLAKKSVTRHLIITSIASNSQLRALN